MTKRLVLPALVLLLPVVVGAQYVVAPTVMAGGGGRLSGGSYVVTGTTGQSSPIFTSTGGSTITHHGFWHAGGGGLGPMVLAIELLNATTARLSWDAVAGATHYDLHRSTNPYLGTGGSVWQTVAAPTTQRDFTSGIGNTATNYFFRGKARNASQVSPASNIVGEFDFGISTSVARPVTPGGGEEALR